ncbi:MAG: hypothetical protein ACN6OM_03925 [Alcaligenes nematophilus]|uniref:hypothetical protein n=1 Tax=Alcaligenes nematophilus TaxID=2994643 RepID=UPI003D064C58
MSSVTVSTTVDIDVDVELSDIDTSDLVSELESRGIEGIDHAPAPQALFQALALGQEDEAQKLLRTYFLLVSGVRCNSNKLPQGAYLALKSRHAM